MNRFKFFRWLLNGFISYVCGFGGFWPPCFVSIHFCLVCARLYAVHAVCVCVALIEHWWWSMPASRTEQFAPSTKRNQQQINNVWAWKNALIVQPHWSNCHNRRPYWAGNLLDCVDLIICFDGDRLIMWLIDKIHVLLCKTTIDSHG